MKKAEKWSLQKNIEYGFEIFELSMNLKTLIYP